MDTDDTLPGDQATDRTAEAALPEEGATPAKRRHSPWLIALEVLTVLGVVAPFVFYSIVNHTKPNKATIDLFSLQIRNDQPVPLTVRTCGSHCPPGAPFVVLTPGSTAQITASGNGSLTRYYLIDGAGQVVGCLPLQFRAKTPGVKLLTSQAVTCPGQPLPVP